MKNIEYKYNDIVIAKANVTAWFNKKWINLLEKNKQYTILQNCGLHVSLKEIPGSWFHKNNIILLKTLRKRNLKEY